ncbi:hypothetical protein NADFUDRAFT_84180 [Nadsonia fulvescens var. elongata DSM 6958]|uniref:Uncharacterized protein n=1 Tax=Nadsonia fulvescens var. elongata DSM 6958 TaxID=857566 RepID=A0A1E3PDL4_9ASCO|nr:hypothetical protein NADFUDRAFT_84180 [Nadsonia fulvescens var. elongata DSM 6958]
MKFLFSTLYSLALIMGLMIMGSRADHGLSGNMASVDHQSVDLMNLSTKVNKPSAFIPLSKDSSGDYGVVQGSQKKVYTDPSTEQPNIKANTYVDAGAESNAESPKDTGMFFHIWNYMKDQNCSFSEFPFCPSLWTTIKTDFIDSSGLSSSSLSSAFVPFLSLLPNRVYNFFDGLDGSQYSFPLSIAFSIILGYLVIKLVDTVINCIF